MASMNEPWTTAPHNKAILATMLQKTSGPFQMYTNRYVELHPHFLYIYYPSDAATSASSSGGSFAGGGSFGGGGGNHTAQSRAPNPYSRVSLSAVQVTNNNDNPAGFVILSGEGDRKVKFICPSIENKRMWLSHLHTEVSNATGQEALHRLSQRMSANNPATRNVLDRSEDPVIQGFLLKRADHFGSSYHAKWVELRDWCICYSKYQSAADDAFKTISLRTTSTCLIVNEEKLRFGVQCDDGQITYFKCSNPSEFERWVANVEQVLGCRGMGDAVDKDDELLWDDDGEDGAARQEQQHAEADFQSPDIRMGHRDDSSSAEKREESGGGDDDSGEDAEEGDALDEESAFEVEDLASPEPISLSQYRISASRARSARSSQLPGGGDSTPQQQQQQQSLDSVYQVFSPSKSTPGAQAAIERYCDSIGNIGLHAMIDRFSQRMQVPIDHPFAAVNEHVNLLDLDAKELRKTLEDLLQKFGEEEALRPLAVKINKALTRFVFARESYVVKRDIAAFCETRGKFGLKLGINGSLKFLHSLTKTEHGTPTQDNVTKVIKLIAALRAALVQFKLDFDVFDESLRKIYELEKLIMRGDQWVAQHKK